jgi:hypothetical protein
LDDVKISPGVCGMLCIHSVKSGHRGRDCMVVWINNYLCNQCLSPLMLWVRISIRRGVLDTALCDKVCH